MPLSDGNFALGKADVSKQDLGKTDTTAHTIVQVRGYVDFMSSDIANSHVLFFSFRRHCNLVISKKLSVLVEQRR